MNPLVENVIAAFRQEMERVVEQHADTLRVIAAAVDAAGAGKDELWWEQIDAMKGALGADAANAVADKDAGRALLSAEEWVGDTITNGGTETWVAAVFALHGNTRALEVIRGHIGSPSVDPVETLPNIEPGVSIL